MLLGSKPSTKLMGRQILLIIPLLVFVFLKLSVDQNGLVWSLSWYTRIFQFYAGSFASLVAIVVAIFSSNAFKRKTPRAMFIAFAFINMSALFLISSIATPNVLLPEHRLEAFLWPLRFAFPMGAIAFFLANIHWENHPQIAKYLNVKTLGFVSLIGLVSFLFIAFAYPAPLVFLNRFSPQLPYLMALITIILFGFSVYRTWYHQWSNDTRIDQNLVFIYIFLAEAEIFQTFGTPGGFSWLLYHPMVLTALMLAIFAILGEFESSNNLNINRYFAVIGSILIAALSLIFGELGSRFLPTTLNRTSIVTLVLAQSFVSFLILYVIVFYLNRLIRERNIALKREQHLRSELTQLIVHDLKSPLTVITSGLNLLGKERLGELEPTQKRLLTNLEQSGKQILFMIDDLLDVERFEAGALNLQTSQINVVKMLDDTIGNFKIVASTNRQELTFVATKSASVVPGDRRLLQRVFHNLLSNALKFTPEDGFIKVSTLVEDGFFVICVEDNGPGVPEHERERIFEKFAQVERVERRGAGLGLTFCKMVVESHGGHLVVHESDLGGAKFRLSLPLPIEPEPVDIDDEFSSPLIDTDLSFKAS